MVNYVTGHGLAPDCPGLTWIGLNWPRLARIGQTRLSLKLVLQGKIDNGLAWIGWD